VAPANGAIGQHCRFPSSDERRLRRILPVPTRSGEGRLTERTPVVLPRRRQRVKVPPFLSLLAPSQDGGDKQEAAIRLGGRGAAGYVHDPVGRPMRSPSPQRESQDRVRGPGSVVKGLSNGEASEPAYRATVE
jgi:hypothetical protein